MDHFRYKNKNYSIYKTYDYKNLPEEDITKIISFKKKKEIKYYCLYCFFQR